MSYYTPDKIITEAQSGKYLTFRLSNEEYGLEILRVKEIIGIMPVTRVPRTPDFIRGVINLRGEVIPVIELRKKFRMQIIDDTRETSIIVVETHTNNERAFIGILVDSVSEVVDIAANNIQDTPSFGVNIDTKYILGMAKAGDSVKILLNIQKLLTENEMDSAAKIN